MAINPALAGALVCLHLLSTPAKSQIVRDGTIGPGASVQPVGPIFEIPEAHGEVAGNNLFHSFSEFNVRADESATFTSTGAVEINNVISRVTGENPSRIDGHLRSTIDGADVYLLNPRGVIIGETARLDLQGAFKTSASETLEFSDGAAFDVTMGEPILNPLDPTSFGFLQADAGSITITGVSLENAAGFELHAKQIELENARLLSANTGGTGDIVLNASDRVTLRGAAGSALGSVTVGDGTGGDITLRAPTIELLDGAFVGSRSFASGDAGNISFLADGRFLLNGMSSGGVGSSVVSASNATGNTGTISVAAGVMDVETGAEIRTFALGDGHARGMSFAVEERLSLSGLDAGDRPTPSLIIASASGSGGAGGIVVDAPTLELLDGAVIATRSLGAAGTGAISITSSERLTMSGHAPNGGGAAVQTTAPIGSLGDAGSITIAAGVIDLEDGAQIRSDSFGIGDAGNIAMTAAQRITLSGADGFEGFASLVQAATFFDGAGGDVRLHAPVIDLRDGAAVTSVSILGSGDSGRVDIAASELLRLSGTNKGVGARLLTATTENASGDAGNIAVVAGTVSLEDGAGIGAASLGTGGAGNIVLRASGTLTLTGADRGGGAKISTTTSGLSQGRAGGIAISAANVSLAHGATIESSSNGAGDAGLVEIEASNAIDLIDSSVLSEASQADGGDIVLRTSGTLHLSGSTVTTSVLGGNGTGGDIVVSRPSLLAMHRQSAIEAEARDGRGGDVRISAEKILQSVDTTISADAGVAGIDGIVVLDSPSINSETSGEDAPEPEYLDASQLLAARCGVRDPAGRFAVAPRRGAAGSPEELLPSFASVAVSAAQVDDALLLAMIESERAFRGGDFERSLANWRKVTASPTTRGVRVRALLGLGQSQQALGHYEEAEQTLNEALKLAEDGNEQRHHALVLNLLGGVKTALGDAVGAEQVLKRARRVATRAGASDLNASIENNLGNAYATRGVALAKSTSSYTNSADFAEKAGDPDGRAKALANAARALIQQGELARAVPMLSESAALLHSMRASHNKVTGLIHLAKSHETAIAQGGDSHLAQAQTLLREALTSAVELNDGRNQSFALGNLAGLYQLRKRWDEALYLTRQALRTALATGGSELVYRWHWQEGRILWARNERAAAVASLRRAVVALEETRQDSLLRYADTASYFQRLVAPVYLDLVDALLTLEGSSPGDSARLLADARETAELLKTAELRNYLRDDCVTTLEAKATPLEDVSPRAAVVYPIVLPERLELLVSQNGELTRYTVPVTSERLADAVRAFRSMLQSELPHERVKEQAKMLHDWLFAPYQANLGDAIDTLVFVPDGVLRAIPMAALHDGDGYLVERYAVAVTPSLTVTDPQRIDTSNVSVLLAGVSEEVREGFEALPFVSRELDAIHALYGGKVLLDGEFTRRSFEQSLRNEPVSIVHIASHAKFLGTASDSFVLAYDGPLEFSRIQETVGITKFREQPLELLVLSACETAAGSDGAALGLAGLAVQAGARSALGSLWQIGDAAAERLMREFYARLRSADTKALALREAQLNLLRSRDFAHPAQWSPFLMINNWL